MEMTDAQTQAWLDQEDAMVRDCVREHGCFLQYVCAEPETRSASFCYSTGFFGLGHPELIVFGLAPQSAGGMLNWCFAEVKAGKIMMPGEILKFGDGCGRARVEEFPNPGEMLLSANRFYQRPPEFSVPAYQLTWDVNGAFPEDPGYPYGPHQQPRPGTL
ncbi:uncharacterized protein DUF4262 [Barrientosiimonas humi]|uniref:Uncharacterized protein DUF4262 n=2 Tax=Barrientosiimonas humi TaxID=999931 RepID=A0A542XG22_9MICO|nr:uncharacterized protein DUF4262 [Barrientosiimonas humi]CAG7570803.1 hypothetical protein BH39T_PBIAJDOK_00043 [Barrientosiimonas humi]